MEIRITALDAGRPDLAPMAAALHRRLLTEGVARLGDRFLERFMYGTLVADHTIRAFVCQVDGDPAGFITYTDDGWAFARAMVRRHPVRLPLALVDAIVHEPRTLAGLAHLRHDARNRAVPPSHDPDAPAEVLAVGVLPEYGNPAFVRAAKGRVSTRLYTEMAQDLRSRGHRSFHALFERDNGPAASLYRMMGGAVRDVRPGHPVLLAHVELDALLAGRP